MSPRTSSSEHAPDTLLFALIRHDVIRRSASLTRRSILTTRVELSGKMQKLG